MSGERLRQPIVCVLGHVDHGKTSILDSIRSTKVAKKEVGGITQRIGATDIDVADIERRAGIAGKKGIFKIPGLLFIDTPGHVAFSNMRARGGALADLAILVVDINEGFKPQTVESINILKKFKTPFIVAANKIDLIPFFHQTSGKSFSDALKEQRPEYIEEFEKRLYDLVYKFYEYELTTDRYDRVKDFSKTVAIVPVSAKLEIGIQDVLVMLAGLAQRYLESNIKFRDTPGKGTVIELKTEGSVGMTLDTVLYQGSLRKGDKVAVNTTSGPALTKVKALLVNAKGKSGKTIERNVVHSASGIRVLISDKLDVVSGSPLLAVEDDPTEAFREISNESAVDIKLSEHGLTIKADALGSLEALAYELVDKGFTIRSAMVGEITRRDVIDVSTLGDPLDRLLIGFNINVSQDAKETSLTADIGIITGNVIYSIVQSSQEWINNKKTQLSEERKQSTAIPAKFTIMPEYIFRTTKPVIVGVKLLSGRIKIGDNLIRSDGRYGGTIKSIRDGEISKQFADAPLEIAISIDGVTLNRQINAGETLYVDIPESVVKILRDHPLDDSTMQTLEEIIKIKRKESMFWGTRT